MRKKTSITNVTAQRFICGSLLQFRTEKGR